MSAPIPNNAGPQGDGDLKVYKAPKRERWLQLRKECVTSTEMAPVSGIPKYGKTRWSIYHEKLGELEDTFDPTERTEVGSILEQSIAKLVGERLGCRVLRLRDFMMRGKLGASFDYHVVDPNSEYDGWLVEIKNVDRMIYREDWSEDVHKRPIAPDHISVQVQTQLEVARRPGTILAALVGGNDLKLGFIARDVEMGAALRSIATQFWVDIDEGNVPEVVPDDAANVPLVYATADPDNQITADPDLCDDLREYKKLGEEMDELKARRNTLKARVLEQIGDASKVYGSDGYTLDAGVTAGSTGKEITEDMVGQTIGARKSFRRFTVRVRKAKS